MALAADTYREETTGQLVQAITQDHFVLYGQRIVPIGATRDSHGYIEVLIRYIEEEENLLPPGGFLEVLESLNLMSVLDRWVLNRVIRSLVGQHKVQRNWDVPRYSVNLSVDSLYVDEFGELVSQYFRKYHLPPDKLRFEVDESDASVHAEALKTLTSKLCPMGCGFTVTSYTGGALPPVSLPSLGVNTVKIEGTRITSAHPAGVPTLKGKAVHQICRELGIRVIAELVEHHETVEKLVKLGIDFAQGYALYRPVPLRTLGALPA